MVCCLKLAAESVFSVRDLVMCMRPDHVRSLFEKFELKFQENSTRNSCSDFKNYIWNIEIFCQNVALI